MAKQAGTVLVTGTMEKLTFYKLNGNYYLRRKSSLTGKRFKKDPAFEAARHAATRFGQSAKLASRVYRALPAEKRKHGVIGQLTAMATQLLKEGMNNEQVLLKLKAIWLPPAQPQEQPPVLFERASFQSAWKKDQKGLRHHYPAKVATIALFEEAAIGQRKQQDLLENSLGSNHKPISTILLE